MFSPQAPGASGFFIRVRPEHGAYTLEAGAVQGITDGSEFAVYPDHVASGPSRPLCTLRVTKTEVVRATLEPCGDVAARPFSDPVYARQVCSGSGHDTQAVHITAALLDTIGNRDRAELEAAGAEVGYRLVQKDSATFVVDVANNGAGHNAEFYCLHTLTKEHGLQRLPHVVPLTAEDILRVLRSGARWNSHLERQHTSPDIQLQLTRVERDSDVFVDGECFPVMIPVQDWEKKCIAINPDHVYGARIVNNTRVDFYPYLFYFDFKNQSIGV